MKQHITQEAILLYLKELKPELKEKGVEKLGLFGSYANNSTDDSSDIDIVIQSSDVSRRELLGLKFFAYMEDIREKIKDKFQKNVDICDEIGLDNIDKSVVLKGAIYV